jgi:hypothetical protein
MYRVYLRSQDPTWRVSQEQDAPTAHGETGQPANTLPLCEVCWYIGIFFVKTYFLAKTSCTYTMNYLHQEKCLRDHGA